MEATQITTPMTPCDGPLPELEVPMINTMVACLASQHRKLDDLAVQLALAAAKLAADPDAGTAEQRALEVWHEIRRDLWSHLQIEDELVFSWGRAQHAISGKLLDNLMIERQETRKLVAALPALSPGVDRKPQTAGDRGALGRTLLALARTLDSHVERYDSDVLPSIRRALFHR